MLRDVNAQGGKMNNFLKDRTMFYEKPRNASAGLVYDTQVLAEKKLRKSLKSKSIEMRNQASSNL